MQLITKVRELKRSVLARNIGGTFLIKGASVVVQLLSVPAYISYFQNDAVLGLWYTLVAALNWILVFDFGVGNGLRNNLSKVMAKRDYVSGKKLVSTAYIFIGFLSLLFIILGEALILNLDLNSLLSFSSKEVSQGVLRLSLSIVYIGIVLQFWLKLLTSILYSMQKTALNNFLFLLGNIILLVWVSVVRFDTVSDRLIAMSLIQMLGINLPLLICSFILFRGVLRPISPSFRYFDRSSTRLVVGLGVEFFVIQIALLIVNSTNEYLITYLYDSSDVLTYQIYYKWFFAIITVFSLVIQPMWSAMTVAWNDHKLDWMRGTYRKFLLMALMGSLGALLLAGLFPLLVEFWIGGTVLVSTRSALVFAFLVAVSLFVNSSTCVANATSKLTVQMGFTLFAACAKVPLCLFLSSHGFGWESIVFSNGLVLVPLLMGQSLANAKLLRGGK